jgi:hypothetical protein
MYTIYLFIYYYFSLFIVPVSSRRGMNEFEWDAHRPNIIYYDVKYYVIIVLVCRTRR